MLDNVGCGGVSKKNARRSASERAAIVVEKNIIIIEINSTKTSLHAKRCLREYPKLCV
jgi:hypothetical protein